MTWESFQLWLVGGMTAFVFVAFVRERMPPHLVALIAFSCLLAFGVLSSREALQVFSNGAPVTIICMFVLSAALERTGVIDRLGALAIAIARRSGVLAIVGGAAGVMLLSAFINNTPVVVVLTPVAIILAGALGVPASRLLIPLSFVAIFGGTTTLIGTSTNLLVSGVAINAGQPAISMFEMTVPGLIMGGVGIAYLALASRWLLPDRWPAKIQLRERSFLTEVVIPAGSRFVGSTVAEVGLTATRGAEVIDLVRQYNSLHSALGDVTLQPGDRLVLRTSASEVMGLREGGSLSIGSREDHSVEPLGSQQSIIMEGVVGPQSRLIGHRIADLNFRRLYGVYIVAVHRQGVELRQNFDEMQMAFGDVLLLEGPPDGLQRLFDRRVLVNLSAPSDRPFRRDKAPIAIGAISTVMILAAFDILPVEALAIIASTVVIALGCLNSDEAYEAVQWRLVILIYGMLGLGLALEKTGAADLIVRTLVQSGAGLGPLWMLAVVYLFTSTTTEVMSNNATAILVTPIAIGIAHELGVDPRPFIMAVLFAASASFATPIGYQTNTFVYNAGGYRFADFLRIGVPLNLLMWLVAMIVIPIFWPF